MEDLRRDTIWGALVFPRLLDAFFEQFEVTLAD